MREFLSQNGVPFEARDFFQQPFTIQELRRLLEGRLPSEVFAQRSPSVKALGLDVNELSHDEMLALIVQEPRLLRRPLVQVRGRLIVGANWEALKEVLQ